MNKHFFQPGRMESVFDSATVLSVRYQESGADAAVKDGTVVKFTGAMAPNDVYNRAYTRAGATPAITITDFNVSIVEPTAAADESTLVAVIDLAEVPEYTVGNYGNIKLGIGSLIGLTAPAGRTVRGRILKARDVFKTGRENFSAAPTVGQFAVPGANGLWTPAASAPATGLYCRVFASDVVSVGINGDVSDNGTATTGYWMAVEEIIPGAVTA